MKNYNEKVKEIEGIAKEIKREIVSISLVLSVVYFGSHRDVFHKEKEVFALAHSQISQDFSWIKGHNIGSVWFQPQLDDIKTRYGDLLKRIIHWYIATTNIAIRQL